MNEGIAVAFPGDGTAVFEGQRGDMVTFRATSHPDVFTLFGTPDPSMTTSLIRCSCCNTWHREAVAAVNLFFCEECARSITTAFHKNHLSDQYEPPTTPPLRPKIPDDVRQAVYERDGFQCRYCGADKYLVLDHVIPVVQKGAHDASNLVAACGTCNLKKGGRTPEEAGMPLLPLQVTA
ncbi:HNH endonuclease (plasmid) [Deinococcus sp. KNUC1210]|uniref:HNH endonuclease n=1 Tax=Deinococcus sp. KNUC1210 TaxID=2917691 RepID=UPI001EF11DB4|nr:HNH endonuclease [Deinococcus sp. KNUC1210]ULH17394.1 HNH endonuclease [Deinococcus sp. KNUC1210]